jgi:uncharacterized phage protein (TIGR01671 family)
MNQLKFRAWNGEEFTYLELSELWLSDEGFDSSMDNWKVNRFTGYTDVNGKEVYEGDILAWPEDHDFHNNDPMPVVFEYGAFCVDGSVIWDYGKWVKATPDDKFAGQPTYELDELEVVGNIYEDADNLLSYRIIEELKESGYVN